MPVIERKSLNVSGVYLIRCRESLRSYIGSARNVAQRWHMHLSKLRRGSHYNPFLQQTFNNNGEEKLCIELLEEVPVTELRDKEQVWVNRLRPEFNAPRAIVKALSELHLSEWAEAEGRFPDEEEAHRSLAELRWPEGVTCPFCVGKDHYFISTRRIWKCKGCKRQFSVKVGTIMEDSPIGLHKWCRVVWLKSCFPNGINSYEVAEHLGISQKSAWLLLRKIRIAEQATAQGATFGSIFSTTPAYVSLVLASEECAFNESGKKRRGPSKGVAPIHKRGSASVST